MKIKAIIFDMDGVLVDAQEWHYIALNKALDKEGYFITRQEHESIYDGLTTQSKLNILSELRGLPKEKHDIVKKNKQKFTLDLINKRCKPNLKLRDTLGKLLSEGYLLGIASNSIRKTVDIILDKIGITHYFDHIVSNEDVVMPKPDPEGYNNVISFFRLKPEQCLALDDTPIGQMSVLRSGANLLPIKKISQVNYKNIKIAIKYFEHLTD